MCCSKKRSASPSVRRPGLRSNRDPAARLANPTLAGVDPSQAHAPLTVTINRKVLTATRKNVAEAIKRVRGQMRGRGGAITYGGRASPSPYRRASGSQAKLQMPRKSGAASSRQRCQGRCTGLQFRSATRIDCASVLRFKASRNRNLRNEIAAK